MLAQQEPANDAISIGATSIRPCTIDACDGASWSGDAVPQVSN